MDSSKTHSPLRRALLLAVAAAPLTSACTPLLSARNTSSAQARLTALETESGGRLGVVALNTADGTQLTHRATERFPLCSTFKVLAVSAILELSTREGAMLQQRIKYTSSELVTYSPVTEKHVADGMTVGYSGERDRAFRSNVTVAH